MGHGVIINCQGCGFEQEYLFGVGMFYSSIEAVKEILDPLKFTEIKEILNKYRIVDSFDTRELEYYHQVFCCKKCSLLFNKLYVKILYKRDQEYHTEYKCPNCHFILEKVEKDEIVTFPCPVCREKKLVISSALFWD